MTKQEIQNTYDQLMEKYEELKREIRQSDKNLYERWKAGGYLIDPDILSMYPDLGNVIEQLDIEDDEEKDLVEDEEGNIVEE